MGTRSSLLLRLLTMAYWLALFTATHIPSPPVPAGTSDKTLHVLAYAGLSFLLVVAFGGPKASWPRRIGLCCLVLIYGAVDELSQAFIATRHPEFDDWLANLAGTLAGLLAAVAVGNLWLRYAKGDSKAKRPA
jgi:VanZ family protein